MFTHCCIPFRHVCACAIASSNPCSPAACRSTNPANLSCAAANSTRDFASLIAFICSPYAFTPGSS
jgi:hypothetical protein